jgi:hypothetical protein
MYLIFYFCSLKNQVRNIQILYQDGKGINNSQRKLFAMVQRPGSEGRFGGAIRS